MKSIISDAMTECVCVCRVCFTYARIHFFDEFTIGMLSMAEHLSGWLFN